MKKLCPNCGRRIAQRNYNPHIESCLKMPNMEEFKRIAPTLLVSEMMQLWDVSDNAIWSRLRSIGIKAKRSCRAVLSEEKTAQVIALYHQNLAYKVISKEMGISTRQVERMIRRAIYHGKIKKRKKIFVKSDGYRCARCGIPLVHTTTPLGKGNLCGFCVDELPVISEGDLSALAIDVLAVAVLDATNGREREQAKEWLASDIEEWWSDAAGLDPEFTRDQARKAEVLVRES